ncbi:abhydrolase domain-containing protein 4-like [Asbolus verrucosus]|uniref:Abhydrolase domain-containing protein 4-like n=1 Tax=Asbolus verrucosus TaxID=1661398 RepID=A0A482VQI4_ASBVE|nr:abhydrolase domain-containing protein 4-like [Asbolus verrucosus]
MSGTVENHEKCGWIKYSESKLVSLEKKIFQVLQTAYKGWHVLIDHKPNIKAKIWTIAMNTESKNTPLVLLHGFGAGVGFWCLNLDSLATNRPVYAIDILERPSDFNPPLWLKTLGIVLYPFTAFNPLATVRAAGPFGPWIVRKMRSDISNKYAGRLEDHEIISDYIYQCNSQKPTGETAFHKMIKGFGWAKNPMLNRIHNLDNKVPITVMNGSHTWMDRTVGQKLKEIRQNSYVGLEIIDQAGHHVHADNPDAFNEIVVHVCNFAETEKRQIVDKVPENDSFHDEEKISTETQLVTS